MKLDSGLNAGSLAAVPKAAREAEAMGFDCLWTAETSHDPFFPLVLAAEHTERVKLGTSIAVAFPRTPMVLAQVAWDLQKLSGGRFILGLGTQVKGHNERRLGVRWEHPGPKLREMILCMRAIWDCWQHNTQPSFKGSFYNFSLMTPFFNPGPIEHPDVPIYIAGVNEYMCRLAGELCHGFHVHPFHSLKYLHETILPNVKIGAQKAQRDAAACALSTTAFVIASNNAEEIEAAKAPVRQQISFYASTRTYIGVLEAHGWGDTCYRLNEKAAKGDWAGMADEITDEMLEVFALTALWKDVAGEIKKKYDGILERVGFYFPYSGSDAGLWRDIVRSFNG